MKWRTTRRLGDLPPGMIIEVIRLSNTGGGHDGQWIVVKYPQGIQYAMVTSLAELGELGISPQDLEERK